MLVHRAIGIVLAVVLLAAFFAWGAIQVGIFAMSMACAIALALIALLHLIAWLLTYPPTQGTSHE